MASLCFVGLEVFFALHKEPFVLGDPPVASAERVEELGDYGVVDVLAELLQEEVLGDGRRGDHLWEHPYMMSALEGDIEKRI